MLLPGFKIRLPQAYGTCLNMSEGPFLYSDILCHREGAGVPVQRRPMSQGGCRGTCTVTSHFWEVSLYGKVQCIMADGHMGPPVTSQTE